MKKEIFIPLILIICAVLAINGTLAYFTDADTARNVITTGSIDITVEEWQRTEDGFIPYPDEPIKAMPGSVISKVVTVKNDEAESYIRAKTCISVMNEDSLIMEIADEDLDKVITMDYNTVGWTYKDGWWYHNVPVKTGTSTSALFETVTFSGENMDNAFQNTIVNIDISAQAVQAANNGTSALTAAGWPE